MHVGSLPDGTKGFDANRTITPALAQEARAKGYGFVMRYARRAAQHGFDLTIGELLDIMNAGLAVGVVQHVAPEGWRPSITLGDAYGKIAAGEAHAVGIPSGVTIWCDLEGVSPHAHPSSVVAFANAWYAAVESQNYHPGLYVGQGAGLSAHDLYSALRFDCYWAAYNLNLDQYPSVRGVAIQQYVAPRDQWIGGLDSQTMDLDVVMHDRLGLTPAFLIP